MMDWSIVLRKGWLHCSIVCSNQSVMGHICYWAHFLLAHLLVENLLLAYLYLKPYAYWSTMPVYVGSIVITNQFVIGHICYFTPLLYDTFVSGHICFWHICY